MSKKRYTSKHENIDLVKIILFSIPFLGGMVSYWSNFLFIIICVVGILYKILKNKKVILPKGKEVILLLLYLVSFLIVNTYAIDKGMNIFYFLKNLSILFFILLFLQYEYSFEDRKKLLNILPYSGVSITIFSAFLALCGNSLVYFNDRFQGIFGYANTFGLFLLLCIVINLSKEKISKKEIIFNIILFIGIIFANSRAIIILTALSIVVMTIINRKNYKKTIILLLAFLALLFLIGKVFSLEKRVNSEMLESGEFTTRLMYYKDALTLIKENPFGYGGDGWYYKQVEMQTGVYDTQYVHNSVLQIILDVGIIPFIGLLILLAITFFDKKQTALNRIIMVLIVGHSLIDIDLEYMICIFIIMLMVDFKIFEIKNNKLITGTMTVLGVIYSMLLLSTLCFEGKNYKSAYAIIPFYSDALEEELYQTTDKDEQINIANRILKLNSNISGAYEALTNEAIEKSDYEKAVEYEEKRLKLNRYTMYNYITYAELLSDAISYYKDTDMEKAKIYMKKICDIDNKIEEILNNTNPLCYKTQHKPNLELPEELENYIMKIENAMKVYEE